MYCNTGVSAGNVSNSSEFKSRKTQHKKAVCSAFLQSLHSDVNKGRHATAVAYCLNLPVSPADIQYICGVCILLLCCVLADLCKPNLMPWLL